MSQKFLDESFIASLKIASNDPSGITAVSLYKLYKDHADKLIQCRALKKASYLQDILIFVGKEAVYKEIEIIDGAPCYLSRAGSWVEVDEFDLRTYTISFDWLLRTILDGLNASIEHRYNSILDEYIWNLGNVYLKQHKIPIIIVRCITLEEIYRALVQYLNKYHIKSPALVLAIDDYLPEYFSLPSNNICFEINEVLIHDENKLYFNIDLMLEKMCKDVKQEGFSNGYRSAYFNAIKYVFTKKQAEVLELLHKAKKPIHQNEIMAIVSPNANHSKLIYIFRSREGMHSAWGNVIQGDGKGYYWLDID